MNYRDHREEGLFDAARRISDARERARFLDLACAGETALRQRLDELLSSQASADNLFRPLRDTPAVGSALAISEEAGAVIGRYKLLEQIGEGGFGVVYVAEQSEPVKRRVALKIIKLGMDTKQVVARFEAERQALALMDHPNIAKVHDGGATETGRPFFVMELVRGVSITSFCEDNGLGTRERLVLFIQVCQAVQHAHQKGIIHRDLKPSNILVTVIDGLAVPKVIDFGVAKATQQELTEKTIFTQFHQFIGTPAYMSPEQTELTRVDIDTRSDIYSLGVLLYELLTGKTPFDGKELLASGLDLMRCTIREQPPLRPSTRLARERAFNKSESQSPKPGIDKDLDWIVMKCLEKDRGRRYETANDLAADIHRYLHNEAVLARPPSALYRLQKAVRRNRLAFAAGLVIALALIAGMATTSRQAARARRAEARARQQFETARAVKDFLVAQLIGGVTPLIGAKHDATNYAVVHRIAQEVEGKFTDQPLVEAEVRWALGEAFWGFDEYAAALAQYQRAFDLRRQELGMAHSDTLQAIAGIGAAEYELGHHRASEQILDNAIATIQGTPRIISRGAALVLCTKGWRWMASGRARESMPYLQASLKMYRATGGDDLPDVQAELSQLFFAIANATDGLGKTEEADKLFVEGMRRCQRVHGTNHAWVGIFLKSHGVALLNRKRLDEAGEKFREALAIFGPTLGSEHSLTLESESLLARVLEEQGRIEEAAASFSSLHRRGRKHLPNRRARGQCRDCAQFFVRHERFAEARAVYADVATAFRAVPPERLRDFEDCLTAIAAVEGWRTACNFCRSNFELFSNDLAIWRTKASVFLYVGDTNAYQRTVATALAQTGAITSSITAKAILEIANLGPCRLSLEQTAQCEAAIQVIESALPRMPKNEQGAAHRAAGAMELRLGRLSESLAHFEAGLTNSLTALERARILNLKGICLHFLGHTPDARAVFDEAGVLMKSPLLDRMEAIEGFLGLYQRTLLIQRQELSALIAAP